MKKYLAIIMLLIFSGQIAYTQSESRFSFSVGIGRGYDDGFSYLPSMPTLHLGLSYEIIDWVSIETNIFSYYRTYSDVFLIKDINFGYPLMDIIVEESIGPFATSEMLEKITNTGIKDIKSDLTLKALNIPWTIGLNIAPEYRNHRFGFFAGLGLTYYSLNNGRDYYLLEEIVLKDGTKYNGVLLSLNTELKHLDLVDHISFSYSYIFKDMSVGIRASRLGGWISDLTHIFDTSVFVKLKI
jgi:hypothetical protein